MQAALIIIITKGEYLKFIAILQFLENGGSKSFSSFVWKEGHHSMKIYFHFILICRELGNMSRIRILRGICQDNYLLNIMVQKQAILPKVPIFETKKMALLGAILAMF